MKKKQTFYEKFQIKNNDVISIIGSGGKTSLLFKLALEAKPLDKKILIATTTKIYMPNKNQYDFIDLQGNIFQNTDIIKSGIYLNAPTNNENKIISIDIKKLENNRKKFDLVLIEADGAKEKPLKAWADFEPIIPDFTTKTIGIIDISHINEKIDEKIIHRLNIFLDITNSKKNEKLTIDHLQKIIKKQMFQKVKSEKYLFINKVENEKDYLNAKLLIDKIKVKTIFGSIKNEMIYD